MSETLEPRQVEKPFLGRWVGTTLALLARSPIAFGAAVALLAILDLFYTDVVPERLVSAGLTLIVGALLLPAFWIVMSALSRHSDRALGRSELLQLAASTRLWGGGLLPGCLLAGVNCVLHWAFPANPVIAGVIGSYTLNCLLLLAPLGVCYFPLLALAPGLTMIDACRLSKKAVRLNDEWIIVMFVAALSLAPDVFAREVPAGVIVTAAFLVFIGVFNYVAYRDIFERRLDYAAQRVFAARPRKALAPKRPRSPPPPERPRPPTGPWVDLEYRGSWRCPRRRPGSTASPSPACRTSQQEGFLRSLYSSSSLHRPLIIENADLDDPARRLISVIEHRNDELIGARIVVHRPEAEQLMALRFRYLGPQHHAMRIDPQSDIGGKEWLEDGT
ncbi:MAG: hypothetical protein ACREV7_03265 [Steroidobacteraceae bacterium]